jgi:hypothetical protein
MAHPNSDRTTFSWEYDHVAGLPTCTLRDTDPLTGKKYAMREHWGGPTLSTSDRRRFEWWVYEMFMYEMAHINQLQGYSEGIRIDQMRGAERHLPEKVASLMEKCKDKYIEAGLTPYIAPPAKKSKRSLRRELLLENAG